MIQKKKIKTLGPQNSAKASETKLKHKNGSELKECAELIGETSKELQL